MEIPIYESGTVIFYEKDGHAYEVIGYTAHRMKVQRLKFDKIQTLYNDTLEVTVATCNFRCDKSPTYLKKGHYWKIVGPIIISMEYYPYYEGEVSLDGELIFSDAKGFDKYDLESDDEGNEYIKYDGLTCLND